VLAFFRILIRRILTLNRSRLEEEMKENHPFFDRPLFALPRGNRFRRVCQLIVYSKYVPTKTDLTTGKPIQRKYKAFQWEINFFSVVFFITAFISVICWP